MKSRLEDGKGKEDLTLMGCIAGIKAAVSRVIKARLSFWRSGFIPAIQPMRVKPHLARFHPTNEQRPESEMRA